MPAFAGMTRVVSASNSAFVIPAKAGIPRKLAVAHPQMQERPRKARPLLEIVASGLSPSPS